MVWLRFDTRPGQDRVVEPSPRMLTQAAHSAPPQRDRPAPVSAAVLVPPAAVPPPPNALPRPDLPRQTSTSTPDPMQLDAAPAAAASARSADDILRQARRDIGKIDRELRQASLNRQIQAPADTKLTRLQKGFADAAAAVPPKWFEAPKVEEIVDEGGYGRKRYRVSTAGGTYCVTYEGVNAPDGIDIMKNGIQSKFTTCPAHEQPPTTQSWTRP